ncbi:exodeoxyribonuclease VII small subunit [Phaeovulum vinaykumarii]|uniref:Exodeoxyribonuclease 7 small subunit n=1 Tax=Phaeovulum vinaykumarii TaxID=407234 RepID=A0A1N7KSA8_9RHOB|nr:exodeoxyribonuclease VII small subunit [Phaeovulum vinaykumarii]SIS64386.1 Exodeoxyribonuclease VII small subunit [Phaeovulum vinaykumarii]SOC01596.1 exodeoxyribonuclease VII small subunit [Phaeovulum vinaykumarii]
MDDISAMSFEDAMAALEKVVRDLEQGQVTLEASIALYERGAQLRSHCDKLLKAAEDRVEKITLSETGEAVSTQPLEGQ